MIVRERWLAIGRPLWVFFACTGIVLFGMTMTVFIQILQQPPARLTEGLTVYGLSLELYTGFFLVTNALFFLTFFVVALLIFLRRPRDGFALFTAIFLVNFGASSAFPATTEFLQFSYNPPLWIRVPSLICSLGSWTFLIVFIVLYPDGHFVPRWSWIPALITAFLTTGWVLSPATFDNPTTPVGVFISIVAPLLTLAALYCQFWRYRYYASPIQRQQTKWFVFAMALVLGGTAITFLRPLLFGIGESPAETVLTDFLVGITGNFSFIFIPIAVGFAILRYRLWDIDILIRKTLTYALVVALLAIVYFGLVILLQQLFATIIGRRDDIITVLSTLAIAALFVPLRNRIQEFIDRRFYRKKYDAQKVLQEFGETVRDETDLDKLNRRLVEVVEETMQPKSVSVWLKTDKPGGIERSEA